MIIKCPNCGKQVDYSNSNPFRPFCSEKCRFIDFSDWIEEKNCIQDETPFSAKYTDNMDVNKH